jgi:hypothetical protein
MPKQMLRWCCCCNKVKLVHGPVQLQVEEYIDEFLVQIAMMPSMAMCNIQNRTIPVSQLISYQKLSIVNFHWNLLSR